MQLTPAQIIQQHFVMAAAPSPRGGIFGRYLTTIDQEEELCKALRAVLSPCLNTVDGLDAGRGLATALGQVFSKHVILGRGECQPAADLWSLASTLLRAKGQATDEPGDLLEAVLSQPGVRRLVLLKEWLETTSRPPGASIPAGDGASKAGVEAFFKLRSGKLEAAAEVLRASGQPLKAAVLLGGYYSSDFGRRRLWRAAVQQIIKSGDCPMWEAAWLGVLVGDAVPACRALASLGKTEWRDAVWLACISVLDAAMEQSIDAGAVSGDIQVERVFERVDAPKDDYFYACYALLSRSLEPASKCHLLLQIHLGLLLGLDFDSALSGYLRERQEPWAMWLLNLFASDARSIAASSDILATNSRHRKTLLGAMQEADYRLAPEAADQALGRLGVGTAPELLLVAPLDRAYHHIAAHLQGLLESKDSDWLELCATAARFLGHTCPPLLVSPDAFARAAEMSACGELVVAELSGYLHLLRIAACYREWLSFMAANEQSLSATSGSRYAQREQQAAKARAGHLLRQVLETSKGLIEDGGAWEPSFVPSPGAAPVIKAYRETVGAVISHCQQDLSALAMH